MKILQRGGEIAVPVEVVNYILHPFYHLNYINKILELCIFFFFVSLRNTTPVRLNVYVLLSIPVCAQVFIHSLLLKQVCIR